MWDLDALLKRLPEYWEPYRKVIESRLSQRFHGDYDKWQDILNRLPEIQPTFIELKNAVTAESQTRPEQIEELKTLLLALSPWRKGPFNLHGIHINSEWRSNRKWSRIYPILKNLRGANVLDVGCSNGYFGWRMLGNGASFVLGIEPSILFCMQHLAINYYLKDDRNWVIPLRFEEIPTTEFEIVLSMGVVYHRRQPQEHVDQLFACTKPGGQVILESIIAPENLVIPSKQRYARMRNVYLVPSINQLKKWMSNSGFRSIQLVNTAITTIEEQRPTEWMKFKSLQHSLDPQNFQITIEGYPRPTRAVLTGIK